MKMAVFYVLQIYYKEKNQAHEELRLTVNEPKLIPQLYL